MVKEAAKAIPNHLLKAARQEHSWTQQDVADQIGAPSSLNVTRWERGNAVPSAYYAQRLCQLFGKSMQELGLLQDTQPPHAKPAEPNTAPSCLFWNVPYRRNPFFTGREALLTLLQKQLGTNSAAAITQSYALHGLGGIGKTQLAVEYAYRCRDAYQAIFWIRAANHETLIADFVQLGSLLHLAGSEAQDQMSLVTAVKNWLTQQQNWLLILDNADDLKLLTDFLPTGPHGHLLLTTRASATGTIALSIPVDKMNQEEGCLLLLHRANLLASTDALDAAPPALYAQAKELVDAVDGLPLALDQAAAYIEETGCSLGEYLDLYQQRRIDLLQWQSNGVSNYSHSSVSNTWQLSFQRVEEDDPAAAILLRLCAYLHPDAISEEMLIAGAHALPATHGSMIADIFSLNRMTGMLRRFSLVQRDASAKALSIHRLVQAVLKDRMTENMRQQWAEYTLQVVNAAFPEITVESWPRCEQCLPHVNSCAALIEEYHFLTPEAGRLLTSAGRYLKERGLYEQARTLLSQALSIREQVFGPTHLETISTLVHLGEVYRDQGLYAQSLSCLQLALTTREQALGPDHLDVAAVLLAMGNTHVFLEQYEVAEALFQRALQLREQHLGTEHPDVASIVVALAQNNLHWGRLTISEAHFLRALPIFEKAFVIEHPSIANILNNMSILYCYQGKYEQAKVYATRSLQCYEQLFGIEHPLTATSIDNLALVHLKLQDFEEAAILFRQTLPIHEKMEGPDHRHTGGTLSNLAQVYTLQGKYEQAEELHLRSLTIYEQAVGKDSVDVAITLRGLVHHYYLQGKYARAEAPCLRALSICEHVLDPENSKTAAILYVLAQLYEAQGKDHEALVYYQRSLTMREHTLGPDHNDTRAALNSYTVLHQKVLSVSEK